MAMLIREGVNSGVARSLRTAAVGRPQALPRSFQPLRKTFAPSIAARYASTSHLEGKIHQVIGAVVDGEFYSFNTCGELPGS